MFRNLLTAAVFSLAGTAMAADSAAAYPTPAGLVVNLPDGVAATGISGVTAPEIDIWDDAKLEWRTVSAAGEFAPARTLRIPGAADASRVALRGPDGPVAPAAAPQTGPLALNPDPEGIASGASSDPDTVWYPNGIDGRWLAVGNPNLLNRRDKVTLRFDISGLIPAGRVQRAVLRYAQSHFGWRDEEIVLEHFTEERLVLSGNDLISSRVEPVWHYVADRAMPPCTVTEIDVTDSINRDLERGFGFATFRIADVSAERFGNPRNELTGVTIETQPLTLFFT